jgi:hypothetical protein
VLAELRSRALEPLPKAPFEPVLDSVMAQLRYDVTFSAYARSLSLSLCNAEAAQ